MCSERVSSGLDGGRRALMACVLWRRAASPRHPFASRAPSFRFGGSALLPTCTGSPPVMVLSLR